MSQSNPEQQQGQPAQPFPLTFPLSAIYLLTGWIHTTQGQKKSCLVCGHPDAFFTFEHFGYDGIERDLKEGEKELEDALEDQSAPPPEMFLHMRQRLQDTQQQGIYQIVASEPMCNDCIADFIDAHLGKEESGAAVVAQLRSSTSPLSCVVAWERHHEEAQDPDVPCLFDTYAQTLEELLNDIIARPEAQNPPGERQGYQDFFEHCCEQRLKAWLEAEGVPGQTEQEREYANHFMAILDQSCLDMATKRLLTEEDLSHIEHTLLTSGVIQEMPQLPVWFHLQVPQPVFGIDPSDQEDSWANERVVAFFFRAQSSREVLSRVLVPPLAGRRLSKTEQPPNWFEWRLDLIDPDGIFFSAMQYYYDMRTGRWRKMEVSTCPVDQCTEEMDHELGYPTVVPCPTCQQAMDHYSRWIATCLQLHLGKEISLKSTAWEIRKRAFFSSAEAPVSGPKKRRKFKVKLRKKRGNN